MAPAFVRANAVTTLRVAEIIVERRRANARHTRFVNVEDVFFLCSVVIESAVPAIRVGAEATSPQGSDQEGNMVKKATKAKTAAKKKAPAKRKVAAKKKK
jgi:hypothetical protein